MCKALPSLLIPFYQGLPTSGNFHQWGISGFRGRIGATYWQTETVWISIFNRFSWSNSSCCLAGPKCQHYTDARSRILYSIEERQSTLHTVTTSSEMFYCITSDYSEFILWVGQSSWWENDILMWRKGCMGQKKGWEPLHLTTVIQLLWCCIIPVMTSCRLSLEMSRNQPADCWQAREWQ